MGKEYPSPEKLASKVFWLSMAGIGTYIAVVFIFIL